LSFGKQETVARIISQSHPATKCCSVVSVFLDDAREVMIDGCGGSKRSQIKCISCNLELDRILGAILEGPI
jgi:phage terminase large subunit-like protein